MSVNIHKKYVIYDFKKIRNETIQHYSLFKNLLKNYAYKIFEK